jgi:hypothetical protein
MDRSLKQKLTAGAAVAVALAGVTVAAVTATGQAPTPRLAAGRPLGHRIGPRDLIAAAGYLHVGTSQLQSDLRSGQTLAQIAIAGGSSVGGLVEALVAAKRARLAVAAAGLTRRVTAEVTGVPGARLHRRGDGRGGYLFAAKSHLGFVAASYLGLPAAQLENALRSGQTLAQVANATGGRTAAGLIDALVAAKQEKLATRAAAGGLSAARESALVASLPRRMRALVNHVFSKSAFATALKAGA